jgi:hypothetical protein
MRRLVVLAAAVGLVFVLAVPAQAAPPVRITVDNYLPGELCDGTVDLIEKGFIIVHEHTKGKVLENNAYHLDVIYTDGEKELFYRDRGRDQVIATETGIIVNVAGRSSFVDDDGFAHIGNFSWIVTWEPFSVELVYHAGQHVDICGYFD